MIDVAVMRRAIAARPGQPVVLSADQANVMLDELARCYAADAMRAGERRLGAVIDGVASRVA